MKYFWKREIFLGKKFRNINLTLHKGEIHSIARLASAEDRVIRALFGADRKTPDRYLSSKYVHSPKMQSWTRFITDRKEEGLILNMDATYKCRHGDLDQLKKGFGRPETREYLWMNT